MKRIVIPEYGQIVRWKGKTPPPEATEWIAYLEEPLYRRLERSERWLSSDGQPVFTWYADSAKAQQWVGVVQIPGVQVEILPKVDRAPTEGGDEPWYEARRNLLYMLAIAGDVPVRSRDVARLTSRRAPLNETLSALFATTLLRELLRGCEHTYVTHEENLRTFKGRLLVNRQVLKNAAHRERFYCRYDEFSADTGMNRVFKAACRVLLGISRTPGTQDALRHCLLLLDNVSDETITDRHFEGITFNRQNERFEDLFHFCRLILGNRAPTISAGDDRSFSLLFDMNKVFERFIAAFLHARVMPGIPECRLYPQARHNRRPLFEGADKRGVLHLAPDILVRHADKGLNLVIDTKWKRLTAGARDPQGGVSPGDLYQLFAYTQRYGCSRSVLLYPHIPGVSTRDMQILDDKSQPSGRMVSIRFVNVNRDLCSESERQQLALELHHIVREGLDLPMGGELCA